MPIQSTLRYQDYQFSVSLASGTWRWVTRVDVSKAQVSTQIRDITSPYGILRDSIPIPGEVVQAMAESITQIQDSYPPSILLGSTSLLFVVDEGRGVSSASPVQVTNNGILGSLLSTSITSSAPYVFPLPANVSGLTVNQSGTFDVSVDSTNLLAIGSPYAVLLTVQSNEATNSPQTVPVTIQVRPKSTIGVSATSMTFTVTAPLTGDFPPIPSQQLVISNTGPSLSVLDYQIRKLVGVSWLVSYAPVFGSINGGTTQPITVVVSPPAGMGVGTYTETLRITGYSTNLTQDVTVTLNIT